MLHIARWMFVPAVVLGWLVGVGPVSAALTAEVRDDAGFFKPETVKKANQEIKDLKHKTKKDLLVETFKTVPADKVEQVKNMDGPARNKFFLEWARSRARATEVNGVYILFCQEPPHY